MHSNGNESPECGSMRMTANECGHSDVICHFRIARRLIAREEDMITLKRLTRLAISAATIGTLANCGAQSAVDATNAMPGKIDATNGQVTETNAKMNTMIDQVEKTNDGMNTMVSQVKETNAGMAKMVDEVNATNAGMTTMVGQVSKTNDGITKTNAAVHNQTLAVALQTMLSADNTKNLTTVTDMLPAGQIFANEATSAEIVQFVDTVLKGLETFAPDSSQMVAAPPTPTPAPAPGAPPTDTTPAAPVMIYPDSYIKSFNHDKLAKYDAAQIIVGLMSDDKVTEIINDQITSGGQYEDTAYKILALRFFFIYNDVLKSDLMTRPLSNPGLIAAAVKYTTSLSQIGSLPFIDKITLTTSPTDMLPSNTDFGTDNSNSIEPISANANAPVDEWKLINKAFDKLDKKYTQPGTDSAKQVDSLKGQVLAHIPKK
jgi:uncharacterized phage infection (PIP) family protein YhgE